MSGTILKQLQFSRTVVNSYSRLLQSSLLCSSAIRLKSSSHVVDNSSKESATDGTKDSGESKPISYTQSKAYKYKASQNFRIREDEMTYPWYTAYIVKGSVLVFLIYFTMLRESNDIDEMLGYDLFEAAPALEIPMLENEVKRLERHGIATQELRTKIEELKRLAKET